MSTLQFRDEGERRAWDAYVAGTLGCPDISRTEGVKFADSCVLDRRERSSEIDRKAAPK